MVSAGALVRGSTLVLLGGLAVGQALAQEPPAPAPEPWQDEAGLGGLSIEELMKVQVYAPAKLLQAVREAPTVGAVITDAELRAYGWLSLNDVLFRQPGFAPAGDYERVTVSARGLYEGWNNNHLLLLMDGVPINNISNGTAYTWEVLPLFMALRVEVWRGPGSALYGTSATNGVVALHSWSPDDAGPHAEGRVRLGNAGTQSYDVLGGQAFSFMAVSAAYNHQRTDGNVYQSLDSSGRTDASGAPQSFAVNDRRASHFGWLKLDGRGPLRGLQLQAHLQHWRFQTGHGWLYVIPDAEERAVNTESRAWLSYRAPPLAGERLQLEAVAQVQHHVKDYTIKYLPDGASLGTLNFPNGVVERLVSGPDALFTRLQAQLRLWREMTLLGGVENHLVGWGLDDVHESNVDLNQGGGYAPFPNNEFRTLRPALESVAGEPIDSVGLYLQYASGRVLFQRAELTAGLRYDLTFFDQVPEPGLAKRHRSFDQLSPRLGLVVFPHETFTLKAMAERAFRAPSPSEMAVSNSLLASSNFGTLQPEQITTLTVAGDLLLGKHVNLRADWYYERFGNQIAFSASQNFVANIYSRTLTGLETEVLFDLPAAPLGGNGNLSGFVNYTFVHLLDEDITEMSITPSDRLTWAPAHLANAGLLLAIARFQASVQGHLQGRVFRRDSDHLTAMTGAPTAFSAFRPASVAPWFTLDAQVGAQVTRWLRLAVQGTNLTGSKGHLLKINDFPFDFRITGRRVLATLELTAERE